MPHEGICTRQAVSERRELDIHLYLSHGAGTGAAWADITRCILLGFTAEHHTLDDLCDIDSLIDRDFIFHAEIAPAKPMITEDLTEPVMSGGVIRVLGRVERTSFSGLYGGSILTSVTQAVPNCYT